MTDTTLTYGGAFLAGLISFFSPCVLPLFPSYATYLGGIGARSASDNSITPGVRLRIFGQGLLFTGGFSLVFIILGAAASTLGQFFQAYHRVIVILAGVIIIEFGLFLTGWVQPAILFREKRLIIKTRWMPKSVMSILTGIGFGLAWTPCIGPYLGSILALAASTPVAGNGITLLGVYSAGLALPFLLSAAGLEWLFLKLTRYSKGLHYLQVISGIVLMAIGLLLITGMFEMLTQWSLQLFNHY